MQTVSAESGVPEPIPENLGKRGPLYAEALEEYAQNMAENIIQSYMNQMEKMESEVSSPYQEQEILAEELALAVIETALEELSVAQNLEDQPGSKCDKAGNVSFVGKCHEGDLLGTDIDQDPETHNSRDTLPLHPPLSKSGLPIVGSLDYPDAPPTTPLVPELERSRRSFARKLKGGLAKVFLPSPPPPTPKEKEANSDGAISNPQVELMEQLMHSLSTNELTSCEGVPQHGASMEAFAEALSCGIMDWVLSVRRREQIPHERDLHLLAQQMAETIITSSLDKTKMLV